MPRSGLVRTLFGIIRPQSNRTEPRRYYYMERCGCLTRPRSDDDSSGQRCSAYVDSRRPEICRQFKPGLPVCREMRKQAGI